MIISRKVVSLYAVMAVVICLIGSAAFGEVTDEGRISMVCGTHAVNVVSANFYDASNNVIASETVGLGCASGAGNSRKYTFPLVEITHFDCYYTADGGALTHVTIAPDEFFFHIPVVLPAPSPGGEINGLAGMPVEGEAYLVVSDHDVMTWPGSECFKFKGGTRDYVAVTWYCETDYPPVFSITPGCVGCSETCNPNCTPAVFASYGYTEPVEMLPTIWVRLFYPIGLTTPGCWCYHFEYQLAVELATFTATPADGAVRLSFATASENDNNHFEIWRGLSKDGEYAQIGTVESRGNSATQQVYGFVDGNVETGVTYHYYLVSVDAVGQRIEYRDHIQAATPTAVVVPQSYALSAYPNPFNPTTTVAFTLPAASLVTVNVYDVSGRLVSTLANERFSEGTHHVAFDAAALPTGVYIARMNAGAATMTTKLLLIK
jgi:hypothetical protein